MNSTEASAVDVLYLLAEIGFGDEFDIFLIVEALILIAAFLSTIFFAVITYRCSVLHINIRLLLLNQALAGFVFIAIRLLQLFVYIFLTIKSYPIAMSVLIVHNGLMNFNLTSLFAMFIERTVGTVFADRKLVERIFMLSAYYDNFVAIEFFIIPWVFITMIKSYRKSLKYTKGNSVHPNKDPEKEREIYFEQLQKQWA